MNMYFQVKISSKSKIVLPKNSMVITPIHNSKIPKNRNATSIIGFQVNLLSVYLNFFDVNSSDKPAHNNIAPSLINAK